MPLAIERIPGGFRVDGLEIKGLKCGCTSVLPCCHSWSKVRLKGDTLSYTGKTTTPETKEPFSWGYAVQKDNVRVQVHMDDAGDKVLFSGYYPPPIDEWTARGWEVIEKEGQRQDAGLWRCAVCKWLYKEAEQPSSFAGLPEDWRCPACKVGRHSFEQVG